MWGQCNETLLDRLQTLQNRAVRVIANVRYEAADHNGLLCDYGWLNVHNLILMDLGVFMYKTQKDFVPDGFTDIYHPVTEVDSYNTRSANKGNLQIPLTNLRAGDKAISVSGARVWNSIPDGIKQAQSLDIFKRELKEYLIKSQQALILVVISIFIVFEKSSTTPCILPFLSHLFAPFLASYFAFLVYLIGIRSQGG